MTQVTVIVHTCEKDNIQQGGNESKFYRTYELPSQSLFQWGSQRNGRSGGQFKIAPSASDAVAQFQKKLNEGYTRIGNSETFSVDQAKLQQQIASGAKGLGQFLDILYAASATTGAKTTSKPQSPANNPNDPFGDPPTPVAADSVFDRITQVNERALAAISLAASEPARALTEYSLLNDALEGLEADMRKVKSYLGTLEILVEEAL